MAVDCFSVPVCMCVSLCVTHFTECWTSKERAETGVNSTCTSNKHLFFQSVWWLNPSSQESADLGFCFHPVTLGALQTSPFSSCEWWLSVLRRSLWARRSAQPQQSAVPRCVWRRGSLQASVPPTGGRLPLLFSAWLMLAAGWGALVSWPRLSLGAELSQHPHPDPHVHEAAISLSPLPLT